MSTGCQVVLGLALLFLVIVVVGVGLVIHSLAWFGNAAQKTPAQYPAPELSTSEELELRSLGAQYRVCYDEKKDFEIRFSPNQLNAFVEREIARKKRNDSLGPEEPVAFHVWFEKNQTVLKLSIPSEDGNYINMEMGGDIMVRNGRLHVRLGKLKLGDQEAPWLVMQVFRYLASQLSKGEAKNSPELDDFLKRVKLLERDGEKIHLIMDGKSLEPPDDEPAPDHSETD
jgi:hypothetical protein